MGVEQARGHGSAHRRSRSGDQTRASGTPTEQDARLAWEQVAGRVSSAAMRARALRSRHRDDLRLSVELDALIVELDGAFGTVMRTGQAPPDGVRSRPEESVGTAWPDDPEQRRFCDWIRARCPTGETVEGERGGAPDDPEELLRSLEGVTEPVPAEIAAALRLPPGARHADAVERLRWARTAPDGPRCRSYWSACLFLADADPDVLPLPRGSASQRSRLAARSRVSIGTPPAATSS